MSLSKRMELSSPTSLVESMSLLLCSTLMNFTHGEGDLCVVGDCVPDHLNGYVDGAKEVAGRRGINPPQVRGLAGCQSRREEYYLLGDKKVCSLGFALYEFSSLLPHKLIGK